MRKPFDRLYLLGSTLLLVLFVLLATQEGQSANSFFNASGAPAQGSALSSSVIRTEFANIGAGFDKMPALTAGTAVVVNGGGTALTNTVGTLALAGNFATTGAYNLTLAQTASVTLTLPGANDTLVGRATTDALTNKTMSGASNTFTNIPISTAISGLGSGVGAFLATPSSANLLAALTTKTGTGNAVFSASPTFTGTITAPDSATWSSSGISGLAGFSLGGGSGNPYAIINGGGPGSNMGVRLQAASSSVAQFYYDTSSGTARISSGTLDPAVTIAANTGVIAFKGYGAGTLTTDASGNISTSSDEVLKTNIQPFTRGIAALRGTAPKTYQYKLDSGLDANGTYTGYVITDAFQAALPEAVFSRPGQPRSLWDRAIIATIHNVVLDHEDRIIALEAQNAALAARVAALEAR